MVRCSGTGTVGTVVGYRIEIVVARVFAFTTSFIGYLRLL